MKSIDVISNISDLKKLNDDEMIVEAQKIREFLIDSLSKTGGHLGSNLGIVELTMALHKNFDSPNDKLIFDVGHQSYVHKILTSRVEGFSTLRKHNGMSGFIKRNESIHDVWESGHSSTSLSAAAGFAMSRDLDEKDNEIVVIIGDGSLTNGMTMEALNHLSELDTKVIVIINDNEMSISKNVGFIDTLLKDLRKNEKYYEFKSGLHKFLNKKYIPLGKSIDKGISSIKSGIKKNISTTHTYFGVMGFNYLGPVDGHNFDDLNQHINYAKSLNNSVIVHVKTIKGMGYEPAQISQCHGIGPFDPKTGKELVVNDKMSYSKIVADTVHMFMEKRNDIIVITPAMLEGSELQQLERDFPNRVTDVGIAEEHALTFASSLGMNNKKPFVSIYSTFLQRAYDQLFHDVIRHNSNVVIGIDRAGLVGSDGETHQGIYDLSFLTHMPNITILQGKDQYETQQLLKYAFNNDGVIAVRYPRGGSFEHINKYDDIKDIKLKWTKNKTVKNYIITYGNDVLAYEELLKDSEEIAVINAKVIKPLDNKMLNEIKDCNLFVVEEHGSIGNLNTLILNYYQEKNIKANIKAINLGDRFIEHGSVDELKKKYKIDPNSVVKNIKRQVLKNESTSNRD